MNYITTYVGMDVHKDTIAVAIAEVGQGEPMSLGVIPSNHDSLLKLLKKLQKSGKQRGCFLLPGAGPVLKLHHTHYFQSTAKHVP